MSTYRVLVAALLLLAPAAVSWADEPLSLAKARTLYNERQYEGAIDAASVARKDTAWADAAALVIARSHLELYRQSARAEDLSAARGELAQVRVNALNPRDQVDLVIGLGLSLYLGEIYGAAGELFDTALGQGSLLATGDRLLLLDWWATSLDREAQSRVPDRRARVFEGIVSRMEAEIRADPGNPVANYWLAVAARGAGDIDTAWNSAIAAWVRSTLAPESTERLRMDLDRLMTNVVIPERARTIVARDPQDALAALRTEWDLLKQQWK